MLRGCNQLVTHYSYEVCEDLNLGYGICNSDLSTIHTFQRRVKLQSPYSKAIASNYWPRGAPAEMHANWIRSIRGMCHHLVEKLSALSEMALFLVVEYQLNTLNRFVKSVQAP